MDKVFIKESYARIVVGGKYFQDHSLKAVTSCENSLKGEIKGIYNSDGLG